MNINPVLSHICFTINLTIDTLLQLVICTIVAFMLTFVTIKYTNGLMFITSLFVVIVISACNLLQAYDNIRRRISIYQGKH